MALMDPIHDLKPSNLTRPDYTGVVVINNDPEKRQRYKVRVAQLHRGIPDEDLPWVMPQNNSSQANAGVGVGGVNVPPKGAKMNYSMTDNDPHNPMVNGSVTTDDVNKDNELLNEDYPGTYGMVDHAGNKEATNTEKNTQTRTHKSGATHHTDGNGSQSQYSPGDITIACKGKLTLAADGGIFIHAKGPLDLKGSTISLNGGGSAATVPPVGVRPRPNIPDPSNNTDM